MPILSWIGKDKVVNHDKELPFRVLKPVKELSVGENSENLLIEGDNLEALKALMPFYYGKVKCVYIDPPYNKGNEKWIYNDRVNSPQIKNWLNKVVGGQGEDLCRHDKWLCMMYPRLKLLKDLLSENGAIFISIDDNEVHHLRQIMDEIFGEANFVTNIIWQKKYSPQNDAKYFSDMHDFIVVYAKHKNKNDEQNGWIRNLLPRTDEMNARYTNPDNDSRGVWKSSDLSVKTYNKETDYSITTPSGRVVNPPYRSCWRVSKEKFQEMVDDNRIWFGRDGKSVPSIKRFLSEVRDGSVPVTIWFRDEVGDNEKAKKEVNTVLRETNLTFETPKPIELIKKIIRLSTDKDSIILDSFAGSGTTGHATLELNKYDNGNRKFILVELENNIAENVISKRLEKVIKGYKEGMFPEGTGQGFEYLNLNGELYDKSGLVNPQAKYEDMAAYIYFTETKNYLDIATIKNPHIGSQGSTHYFLFFEGKGKNILDEKTLKKIYEYNGKKVIYADKCLIDDEQLEKLGITFKQIPYELKKY